MKTTRNWLGVENNQIEGQAIVHSTGWVMVTVKRADDNSRNVGVTTELDDGIITFTIRARIDPMDSKEGSKYWIGLVEYHLLPLMQKGDHWLAQQPDDTVREYRVMTIDDDEIMLVQL